MIYSNIIELIGNTPILELPLKQGRRLFLKMEKYNPGQSMKDRMAIGMILGAEKRGLLKKGGRIIESSSGNTAIGLAIVSALKGYKFIAVVDHHAAPEKIATIKAYGGDIIYVKTKNAKDEVAVVERERLAAKLAKETPNSFNPYQAHNLDNRKSYIETLGQEILNDIPKVDYFIASIGTGGSLSGTAEKLKKANKQTQVIAVEPKGSIIFGGKGGPYFQSGTGNPPDAKIAKNVNFSLIDDNCHATDQEAFNTCRYLAKTTSIMIGGSSGGVLFQAIKLAYRVKKSANIVVLIADGGEKYLSTIFNDDWMEKNKLVDQKAINYLKKHL